jgi:hypothetical protein
MAFGGLSSIIRDKEEKDIYDNYMDERNITVLQLRYTAMFYSGFCFTKVECESNHK